MAKKVNKEMVKKSKILCPICDSQNLEHIVQDNKSFEYKNLSYEVSNLKATRCSDCEFEFVSPKQKSSNETLIRDEKRKIDNFLTGSEIKDLRELLNITQEQAALLFGGGIHGFSKYERGEVIQSTSMDRLLRVASELPEAFRMVSHLSYGQSTQIKSVRKIIDAEKVELVETAFSFGNVTSLVPKKAKKKRKYTIDLDNGAAVA